MPRGATLLVFTLTLALAFSGCAWGKKKRARREAAIRAATQAPRIVGTIALVNAEGRFALVDSGMFPTPESGAVLRAFTGDMESAELRASEVRKRPFVIADIVRGLPRKGDRVVQLASEPEVRKAEPTAAAVPPPHSTNTSN